MVICSIFISCFPFLASFEGRLYGTGERVIEREGLNRWELLSGRYFGRAWYFLKWCRDMPIQHSGCTRQPEA